VAQPLFPEALRDIGYVEEKNIQFKFRSDQGEMGRLPELAAELVQLKVNVIVPWFTPADRVICHLLRSMSLGLALRAISVHATLGPRRGVWPNIQFDFTGSVRNRSLEAIKGGSSITEREVCCSSSISCKFPIALVMFPLNFATA
jgi:hypothetical protein